MASFADTVAFCFPASSSSAMPSRLRANGAGSTERPSPVSAQQDEDLSRGTKRVSVANVLRTYAPDWFLVVVLWGILALLNRSPGHKREFSLNDISIQHSFAEQERVPPPLLAFFSLGIPLLVLLPLSFGVARSGWDVHNSIIGLFMSYTMTGVVTQIVKMSVGRPRPDLIARCLPRAGSADHPVFGLSTYEICTTQGTLKLDDGFKSFPSGHSSLSFAGLGFLALYLAGKMHLWDHAGHRTRAWFALSPLLGGAMVAISRTEDNRHHWQDVLVGSLLGLSIAWVSYRTYYPRLSHPQCHLPLAPRNPDLADDEDDYSDDEDVERRRGQRVRLIEEEQRGERAPRASEEQVAWRT